MTKAIEEKSAKKVREKWRKVGLTGEGGAREAMESGGRGEERRGMAG